MKLSILPYAIKYYFPWVSTILKKKHNFVLNRKNIHDLKPQKATSRYCYSVWLRHLTLLNEQGLNTNPKIIAELGPGDSIGVGLMALLTGAKKYYALDVVKHTALKQNVKLLDELIELLLNQKDIPNEKEFPRVYPRLKSYLFPSKIITKQRIMNVQNDERIRNIKKNLLGYESLSNDFFSIQYFCPWYDSSVINKESVDMIFSQAVLEHVNDLSATYKAMYLWLKRGGIMSHQIDFKSHGTADEWNGHWAYSDLEWKLIKGKDTYGINRAPLSVHVELLNKTGFKILSIIPIKTYPSEKYTDSIHRDRLANRFKMITEEDFSTSSAHILSIK